MIYDPRKLFTILFSVLFLNACQHHSDGSDALFVKKWEKLTLTFEGPTTSELATDNPFLNYRLSVRFFQGDHHITIPGFYAADGNAAETSASEGKIWKVHFRPDRLGDWNFEVSFQKAKDIAIADANIQGKPVSFDGQKGKITVLPNSKSEGRLSYTGKRYLQYTESGKYFLKGGTDSPENVFGYTDFDGTVRGKGPKERKGEANVQKELHTFEKHLPDWNLGDPTWQGGKGKSLIGGLNYLASKGINSLYFLTMNIDGDGKDVYPFTSYDERLTFDCSKLDQWEIVMDHMDSLGIMQHIVFQETENELMQDNGDTKYERKIYIKEMIARFAHHPRITWNMGEENGPVHWRPEGQNTAQQKAMVAYVKTTDPYKNLTVIHSHSDKETRDKLFEPMLGFEPLDGMSMQVANKSNIHEVTKQWIKSSSAYKKQWVMCIDEIGPWFRGVDPDDRIDNNQDTVRAEALWGNLMAGGAGAEWYFGAKNHSNDLSCEDWRTRDRMWDYTNNAISFFNDHIPFYEMESHDKLLKTKSGYCFAKPGSTYLLYLLYGGSGTLDLTGQSGNYSLRWYNPRTGGKLLRGSVEQVNAGSIIDFGKPPSDANKDWAILIKKNN